MRKRRDDRGAGQQAVVEYSLPPPDELVQREETEKVSLVLSKHSVDFFRRQAERLGVPYQRMIRVLIDRYVEHHESGTTR
jgi:predicted DNA binding CopG/RHH family protein